MRGHPYPETKLLSLFLLGLPSGVQENQSVFRDKGPKEGCGVDGWWRWVYHGGEESSILGVGASISNTHVLHLPDQGTLLLHSRSPNPVPFLCQLKNLKTQKVRRATHSSSEISNPAGRRKALPRLGKQACADTLRKRPSAKSRKGTGKPKPQTLLKTCSFLTLRRVFPPLI